MRITIIAGLVAYGGVVLADPLDDAFSRYQTLVEQGRNQEALAFAEEAVRLSEKEHGKDHETTAVYYNNLGLLCTDIKDFSRAERLLRQALAINEKAAGENRPEVEASLVNLGLLHSDVGDFVKAKPLLERALAINEKAFGPDHSSVATILNNLGALHKKTGHNETAAPFYKRALTISERELGADHPRVATLLNNLGAVYEAPEDQAKAEALFRRALAIYEKALGRDHPATQRAAFHLQMFVLVRGVRTWTDATGRFSREARFIELSDATVTLLLATGKRSRITVEKLSDDDQEHVFKIEALRKKTIDLPDRDPFE